MEFERFNQLATSDRVTLFTALELLMQNGREVIQAKEPVELTAACVESLGGFMTEGKLREVAAVSKELAGLELNVLLSYIRHSNMDVKLPGADESGICPICGCELEYRKEITLEDDAGYHEWTCPECGATGREYYDKVFDRHYEVKDKDGKPYLQSL